MKVTQEQLEEQRKQFKAFLEKAEYEHIISDGLIADLVIQLDVFKLCMDRIAAKGFDPPTTSQLNNLSLFWCDLSHNLEIALELLDMAASTEREFAYNPEESGEFLSYISLKHKFNGVEK